MKTLVLLIFAIITIHFMNCSEVAVNPKDKLDNSSTLVLRSPSVFNTYNEDEDQSYQIQVEVRNDTIYATRSQISYSQMHSPGMFVNLSGISMVGDSSLSLNSDTYWFLPFSEDEFLSTSLAQWVFKCGCGGAEMTDEGCEKEATGPTRIECFKTVFEPCSLKYCIGYAKNENIVYAAGGIMVKGDILVEP